MRRGSSARADASVLDLRTFFQGPIDPGDSASVTAAFAAALLEIEKRHGGTLYVPPGVWRVRSSNSGKAPVRLATPGMTLICAGMRATRVQLDGAKSAVITVLAPAVCIERMTVGGNLHSMDPGGVGIAVRRDPTFVSIRDVVVESVGGYGIFFKSRRDDPEVFANNTLRNVVVKQSGDDGIDFKAMKGQIERPYISHMKTAGPRALMRNVAIRDHSQLYPHPQYENRGERGIDVRGQVHLHNVEVVNVKPGAHTRSGAVGVKFRNRGTNGTKGSGAEWSTLENFFVSRLPAPPPNTRGGGVKINASIADRVYVSNGNVVDLDATAEEYSSLRNPPVTVISRSVIGDISSAPPAGRWAALTRPFAAIPLRLFSRAWQARRA